MINKTIRDFIKQNELYVLRSKLNHRALNVSYSKEGLIYTLDNQCKFIMFKNAWVKNIGGRLTFKGNTALNEKVYVEKFIPRNFDEANLQKAEFTFIDKALKLLNYHEILSQLERTSKEL
ncbi:MAG: hypothetical protein ACK5U7_09400 [Bacteroidota bacterium]|jgi:hypothetical protein